MAICPAHDDKKASLAVGQGDKGIVMKCLAGCETEAVAQALGITMADLFEQDGRGTPARSGKAQSKASSRSTGRQAGTGCRASQEGKKRRRHRRSTLARILYGQGEKRGDRGAGEPERRDRPGLPL